jgi:ribosomal protein S18 acetylase RimI-like enzyme
VAAADLILRPGGPDDVDAAVGVFASAGAARRGTPVPPDRVEEVRQTLSRPETWFFVAELSDSTVGMAAAMPSRQDFGAGPVVPGLCYLDLIFVEPAHWGEGIGALLLDTVIAEARGRAFTRIHLLTHDDNERAHGLYASRGFARTGWSRMSRNAANGVVSEWARDL